VAGVPVVLAPPPVPPVEVDVVPAGAVLGVVEPVEGVDAVCAGTLGVLPAPDETDAPVAVAAAATC
jgi:hypothetical protein